MAIGKNKRLTKCVAASEAYSEDCSQSEPSAKASRAEARSAYRPPPRRRRQQQQLWRQRSIISVDYRCFYFLLISIQFGFHLDCFSL